MRIAVPTVKLGATFSGVDSYAKRFPHGMPKTKSLERLTVTGDVTFGANVKLQGTSRHRSRRRALH